MNIAGESLLRQPSPLFMLSTNLLITTRWRFFRVLPNSSMRSTWYCSHLLYDGDNLLPVIPARLTSISCACRCSHIWWPRSEIPGQGFGHFKFRPLKKGDLAAQLRLKESCHLSTHSPKLLKSIWWINEWCTGSLKISVCSEKCKRETNTRESWGADGDEDQEMMQGASPAKNQQNNVKKTVIPTYPAHQQPQQHHEQPRWEIEG